MSIETREEKIFKKEIAVFNHYKNLAESGYEYVKDQFSSKKTANQLNEFYLNMVK